jgi:hypothetical protein
MLDAEVIAAEVGWDKVVSAPVMVRFGAALPVAVLL